MNILAIDPGLHGAWAYFSDGEDIPLYVGDLPIIDRHINIPALCDEITWTPGLVEIVLEKQQAAPGQGVSSTHLNGVNYGMLLGWAFTIDGSSIYQVRPAEWKRALKLDKDKEKSRAMALHLWPTMGSILKRKKDEGRAEAMLLGYYWRRYGGDKYGIV